ncbi:MAG: YbjN domain-containing protein [Actinomycetes bacterium]
MNTTTLLRSHVERALQRHWECHDLVVDSDGDYPFRAGPAMVWVGIDECPPAVRVFAHAATGIKRSAKLLAEINELNANARWAKVFWSDGIVLVSRVLDLDGADAASIGRACDAVAVVAQDVGPMMAAVYGGATPFPPEVEHAADGR